MVVQPYHIGIENHTPHATRPRHLDDAIRRPQWVSRRGKIPIDAKTGRSASSTNPATWSTYTAALAYPGDGIGYMLTAEDPYTVIDLDKCRNADTGQVDPDALAIVDRFNSYTEVSPSGTGLHIWIRATIPGDRRRAGRVEMYDRERYMTVTGKPLPGYSVPIRAAQDELEAFYADVFPAPVAKPAPRPAAVVSLETAEIIRKASAARNGHKFRALYAGDTTGYRSASEADTALLGVLAFWTGRDAGKMLEIWRASGLYRPKLDRDDYAERTIAYVLDTYAGDVYNPDYGHHPAPIVPEILEDEPEPDFETMTPAEMRAAWRAERAARRKAERTLHAVQTIMQRDNLQTGPRMSLIGAALEISDQGAPTQDGYMVTAPRIARRTGQKPKTVARHLKDAQDKGAIDRHVVTRIADAEGVDSETGEIVPIGKTIQVGYIRASNVIDFAAAVAGYERKADDKKHGGDRPRCPHHPDADTYTVTHCAECHKVVKASRNAPAGLSPQDEDMEQRAPADTPDYAPYPQDEDIDTVSNNLPKMGIWEPAPGGLAASVRGGWSPPAMPTCGAIGCSEPVDHEGKRCPAHTWIGEVAS